MVIVLKVSSKITYIHGPVLTILIFSFPTHFKSSLSTWLVVDEDYNQGITMVHSVLSRFDFFFYWILKRLTMWRHSCFTCRFWTRHIKWRIFWPRDFTKVCIHFCLFNHLTMLTDKLLNLNFHPLEVVSRWRDPQLQVSENYSDVTKWRSAILKSCWLMSRFSFDIWYLTL